VDTDIYSEVIPTCCDNLYGHRRALLCMDFCCFLFLGCCGIQTSQANNAIGPNRSALLDLFRRVESSLRRLETYIEVQLTARMTEAIMKVMAEVLCILAIATKEINQNRASKFIPEDALVLFVKLSSETVLKKLIGRDDIEDALERFEKVTTEEARMTAAEALNALHGVGDKVMGVDNKVHGVQSTLKVFEDMIQGVGDKVNDVGDKVINGTEVM